MRPKSPSWFWGTSSDGSSAQAQLSSVPEQRSADALVETLSERVVLALAGAGRARKRPTISFKKLKMDVAQRVQIPNY